LQQIAKPDVVAPGDSWLKPEEAEVNPTGYFSRGIVSVRSQHSSLISIDAARPDGPYARMSGTSQATAVVSGLAALALEAGRERGIDFGGNPAIALREIFKEAARPLRLGTTRDYGYGAITLPLILETLESFANDPVLRKRLLFGSQLRLVE
jgi:subtilisin family serine protease